MSAAEGGSARVRVILLDSRPRKIKLGDKVRARFRTGEEATRTALDLYFELE